MTDEELLVQVLPAWRAELPREQAEQLDAFLEQPRFRRRVLGLLRKYLSGTVPVVSTRAAAPRPLTLAELASKPRTKLAVPGVVVEADELVKVWRWRCPHCDLAVSEPLTTPRELIVADPACIPCRAEYFDREMAEFRKALRAGHLPSVTGPPSHWRSDRVSLREGKFTRGTRIGWTNAAEWAAGFETLERRRETHHRSGTDLKFRHLRALAAEPRIIAEAPLEDVEWIESIARSRYRSGKGPSTAQIIGACDRRLAQLRKLYGDDGSRVYVVEVPSHAGPGIHWRVYRKGGVGSLQIRHDIAERVLRPLAAGRRQFHVRGWARGLGYSLTTVLGKEVWVGTFEVKEALDDADQVSPEPAQRELAERLRRMQPRQTLPFHASGEAWLVLREDKHFAVRPAADTLARIYSSARRTAVYIVGLIGPSASLTLARGQTRADLRERGERILERGGLSGAVRGLLRHGLEHDSDDLAERVAEADEDYERRRAGA